VVVCGLGCASGSNTETNDRARQTSVANALCPQLAKMSQPTIKYIEPVALATILRESNSANANTNAAPVDAATGAQDPKKLLVLDVRDEVRVAGDGEDIYCAVGHSLNGWTLPRWYLAVAGL
jgi:hypothetical protein